MFNYRSVTFSSKLLTRHPSVDLGCGPSSASPFSTCPASGGSPSWPFSWHRRLTDGGPGSAIVRKVGGHQVQTRTKHQTVNVSNLYRQNSGYFLHFFQIGIDLTKNAREREQTWELTKSSPAEVDVKRTKTLREASNTGIEAAMLEDWGNHVLTL